MREEAIPGRRILAAVLPRLLLSLGKRRWAEQGALAGGEPLVVLDARTGTVVDAEHAALEAGVRLGQSSTAASSTAAVRFASIEPVDVERALDRIAEPLLTLAPTVAVAIQLPERDELAPLPDTVWIDVTGAAHLWGGEQKTIEAARARITAVSDEDGGGSQGYGARFAIASGPAIAAVLARCAALGPVIATHENERALLGALPLASLTLPPDVRAYLVRLGLSTLGALAQLPRGPMRARLFHDVQAGETRTLLRLLEGRDDAPLMAWAPPRRLLEEQRFEEALADRQALVFVARGMTARLATLLTSRGEATGQLELKLGFDRGILRLSHGGHAEVEATLVVGLPVPLADGEALLRTLMPVIERAELPAPVTWMGLEAKALVRARESQLDLGGGRRIDPTRLPRLAAELSAQLGEARVGVMERRDAHRPEKRFVVTLAPLRGERSARVSEASEMSSSTVALVPSRLLPEPLPIGRCEVGARLSVGGRSHTIEAIEATLRMEGVEWWTTPVSREYLRVALVEPRSGERSEALVFREIGTGKTFLHGWFE